MVESEGAGPEISLDVAVELIDWPRAQMKEIRELAGLVRTKQDAVAVLRLAYTALFQALPQNDWPEWDEISNLLPQFWDKLNYGVGLIRAMKRLGTRVANAAGQMRPGIVSVDVVGSYAWSLLATGLLALAISRRAQELLRESARALRGNLGDLIEAGREPGIAWPDGAVARAGDEANEHGQT